MAVGAAGTILSSLDGATWTHEFSDTDAPLTELAYGNGRFATLSAAITATPASTFLTSTNGSTWSKHTIGVRRIELITFVNGFFKGFADVGLTRSTIVTSTDGMNWATNSFFSVKDMAYGDGLYVSVGPGGNILSSRDATAWSWRNSGGTQGFTNVVFGNGTFVATGGRVISTSRDGATWPTSSFAGPSTSPIFENGQFLLPGTIVWASTNGVNWNQHSTRTKAAIYDVAFGNGTYVAVGDSGTLLTSPDLTNWTARSTHLQGDLTMIAYGDGVYVAAGPNGKVLASSDGVSWKETRSGSPSERLPGLTRGPGYFVAVGSNGPFSGAIWRSADGSDWQNSPVDEQFPLLSVAHGKGLFVAVADGGTVLTSTNALSWTRRVSGTEGRLQSVAFGNDRFVAIGGLQLLSGVTNIMLVSSDGVGWSPASAPIGASVLSSIQYASDRFLMTDTSGALFSSHDGINWSGTGLGFRSVAFGGGVYAAIASTGSYFSPDGRILIATSIVLSPDGRSWFPPLATGSSLNAISFVGGRFVAVGANGAIVQSAPVPRDLVALSESKLTAGPAIELNIIAPARWPLRIQASRDLLNWTTSAALTNHSGTFTHREPLGQRTDRRFFRVRTP